MCRTSKEKTKIKERKIKMRERRIDMNELKEIIIFMESCEAFCAVIIDGKKVYDMT